MEEHLQSVLSAALSFPVAWGTLGRGTGTPRAVLSRTGGTTEHTLTHAGLTEARVQVDCYGKNYGEAIIAARAVRAELEGYQGGPVQGAFVLIPANTMPTDDAGLLHRVMMTFAVTFEE